MQFHQRQISAAEVPRAKRWRPEQVAPPADRQDQQLLEMPRALKSDHYVTVDEQLEGVVSVVAAPWPTVDASGLRFDGDISSTWFDAAELQAVVDGFRAATDQLSRPLRIGDTFWVRGYDASSLDAWRDLRDVTRQARGMARVVVAAVAIGDVDAHAYAAVSDDELAAYDNADVGDLRQNRPPPGLATASPTI
jgi:hypothetical protein